MGGGVILDEPVKSDILAILKSKLPDEFEMFANYISKTGSGFFVVVYIAPTNDLVSVLKIEQVRMSILNKLTVKYHNVEVELVLEQNEEKG